MQGPLRACSHGARPCTTHSTNLASWCSPHPPAALASTHVGAPRGRRPGRSPVRPSALAPSDASTLLLYVMDIYDPWSYAYLPSVSAVLRAACPLVGVEVVHSNRYAAQPTSVLAAAVTEARLCSDAEFGPAFLTSLESGALSLDVEGAAAAMIALLAGGVLPVSTVLGAVQHEFFVNGRPLEAPGVLGGVAGRLGLDAPAIEVFAASARARELAREDFAVARELDIDGGPLLLASRGDRLFEFDGLGATGERLVDQFRSVLAKP